MRPTLKTRKPIDRLTHTDLSTFPIWEFATDEEGAQGHDETWVRPLRFKRIPRDVASLSVAGIFRAHGGKRFFGILDVSTADPIEIGHGALIYRGKYIFIPARGFWRAKQDAEAAAKLVGMPHRELFPLSYELASTISGETIPRIGVFAYGINDA